MVPLFSPLQIKSLELKNRLAVSPMCQYSSEDGFIMPWHEVHYGTMALSGAALVTMEASAVSQEGRITAADLGIWKDDHIAGLKKITAFIEAHDAIPGIQLAHAGRKASHQVPWTGGKAIAPGEPGGWKTFSASALPFGPGEEAPDALDAAGIEKVKQDFAAAARRALLAGFKVIEIHAAHGYLINQFLSPLSNRRTDDYGGSFGNRISLLVEIIAAVRQEWPADLPLFVRISSTDWTEGGWTSDDSVALAKILKTNGVDLVDCSSGGNVAGAKIPLQPGYQVRFAEAVRATGVLTSAVGLINDAKQANDIIASGKADLVSLARAMLRDPRFPLRAAHELGQEIPWPVQYERAKFN